MNAHAPKPPRAILQTIARRAMLERGLLPDFSTQALAELDRLAVPPAEAGGALRDLRDRPWCSIDNRGILSTSTSSPWAKRSRQTACAFGWRWQMWMGW